MDERWLSQLGRRWKWIMLRGVAATIFGVLAFLMPGITLAALTLLWGAYALMDGIFAFVTAFRARSEGRAIWPFVLMGIAGVAAGVFTAMNPGITALALLFLIASWAIVIGILQIVVAIRIRKEVEGEWMLALSGVLSMAFGALAFANPGAGALSVVWMIGAFSLAFGIILIGLGMKLRGFSKLAGAANAALSGGKA